MVRNPAGAARRLLLIILATLPFVLLNPVPLLSSYAAPASDHPRLWIKASDLSRLRSWAVESNPIYRDSLAALIAEAVKAMDAGQVPAQDQGGPGYDQFPTEMVAELFAFMSLIDPDAGRRDNYAKRAHTLLMYEMDKAAGPMYPSAVPPAHKPPCHP